MALPINIVNLLNKKKVESNRIEFKSGWNPITIYHSICTFANDFDNIRRGYILVGVEEYVSHQREHHHKMTFEEEYIKFLKLHNAEYDERYVLAD